MALYLSYVKVYSSVCTADKVPVRSPVSPPPVTVRPHVHVIVGAHHPPHPTGPGLPERPLWKKERGREGGEKKRKEKKRKERKKEKRREKENKRNELK